MQIQASLRHPLHTPPLCQLDSPSMLQSCLLLTERQSCICSVFSPPLGVDSLLASVLQVFPVVLQLPFCASLCMLTD